MKNIYLLLFFCSVFVQSQYYVGVDKNYQYLETGSEIMPTSVTTPEGYLFYSRQYTVTKILPDGKRDATFNLSTNYEPSPLYYKNQSLYVIKAYPTYKILNMILTA